ncbi:hypothetical protein ACO0LD_09115 [Undibacterium sp. Ji83W]|uniref:hypothetical protein n=1 Tax=Undibacterium sp. Ji83W TaxID=3413043 RepID=UPI003BF3314A
MDRLITGFLNLIVLFQIEHGDPVSEAYSVSRRAILLSVIVAIACFIFGLLTSPDDSTRADSILTASVKFQEFVANGFMLVTAISLFAAACFCGRCLHVLLKPKEYM